MTGRIELLAHEARLTSAEIACSTFLQITSGLLQKTVSSGDPFFLQSLSIQEPVDKVIKEGCITVPPGMLAAKSLEIMQSCRINSLLVTDENNQLLGAFNMHDLLVAGVL